MNKKLNNHIVEISLCIALMLCAWTIFSIQLGVIPLLPCHLEIDTCNALNAMYVNLSYSFIAGCVFYVLTLVLPEHLKKKRMKPVLQRKMDKSRKALDDIVLEFSRGLENRSYEDRESLSQILDSKSWTDIIPMQKQLYSVDISYVSYISVMGKYIHGQIIEIIDLYHDIMSTSQIISLENFLEFQIFKMANQLGSMPRMNLDDPSGKKYLIDSFCEMYFEFQKIYKTFE